MVSTPPTRGSSPGHRGYCKGGLLQVAGLPLVWGQQSVGWLQELDKELEVLLLVLDMGLGELHLVLDKELVELLLVWGRDLVELPLELEQLLEGLLLKQVKQLEVLSPVGLNAEFV